MSTIRGFAEWLTPAECMAEISKARPRANPGKELATAAMMAAFRTQARLAVFSATDGSGKIVRREQDFLITPEFCHPSFDPDGDTGFHWINVMKAEARLIPPPPNEPQLVMLYGLTYHRDDVALHFGLDLPPVAADRPRRGFADSDRRLIDLMQAWLVETDRGVTAASEEFASQALGGGSEASKAKRLERRFIEEFGSALSLPKTP